MNKKILFIIYLIGNSFFRETYRDVVIRNLIKSYNDKLYFDPKYGINIRDYKSSKLSDGFNEYHSEDRIFGKLYGDNDFQMAEVVTSVATKEKVGRNTTTYRSETFSGLYGVINLNKSIICNILVLGNSNLKRYNKDRIEIDSSEFFLFSLLIYF